MKLDAYWCGIDGLTNKVSLELTERLGAGATVGRAVELLPADLKRLVCDGTLQLACFGQHRSLESALVEGDRLELLGPVLLDVKAERSARVKAARARERGPYNRSFSGQVSVKRP